MSFGEKKSELGYSTVKSFDREALPDKGQADSDVMPSTLGSHYDNYIRFNVHTIGAQPFKRKPCAQLRGGVRCGKYSQDICKSLI